jgi:DNA (cytosine-5)-methyltransferase 1
MGEKTAVSLFSGIGGFEVGLAAAGTSTSLMCEKDPTARAVLRDRFPNIEIVDDIVDLAVLPECSILVGGWPCQDLSQAGRMAGIEGLQSGLVSHVFRLLDASDTMPPVVLLENVAFALSLKQGEAIRHVTSELAARGYRWAYRVLDSREFGLPQRRRRVFICGMLDGDPAATLFDGLDQASQPGGDPVDIGFYWTEGNRGIGWTLDAIPPLKGGSGLHIPSPPAIWNVEAGRFTVPSIEDAERLQGFEAGWTRAARDTKRGDRERWRLVGNAVSIPVVRWLAERVALDAPIAPELETVERRVVHVAAAGGPDEPTRYCRALGEGPSAPRRVCMTSFGLTGQTDLSRRAAEGFLRRYMRSGLRKNMDFAAALARYCELDAVPIAVRS